MTAQQFVPILLDSLFNKFNTIEYCKYEIDRDSDTLFIQIPKSIYEALDFPDFDVTMTNLAIRQKLDYGVCFVTEDSEVEFCSPKTVTNYYNKEAI
ncbi:MAG: hypothetical protein OEY51_09915 [Cyclobacteriaceae bacterium]|nr:hypothetical protein [Cyclobacteriaceae bacterium]